MPTPNPDETQEQYISRCVPAVIDEGTAADPEQAAAVCNSMWDKHMQAKAAGTDLWVTVEQMKSLCPSCAEKMQANNLSRVNLRMLPDEIKAGFSQGLCGAVSGDPGFLTSCMGMTFEGVTDQEAFCASLHEFCTDEYPAQPAAKAFDLSKSIQISGKVIIGAVKAVGDWTLDVLAIPYGGPHNGKDLDGQYFSPATKLYEDRYPSPIVAYYHGYNPDGTPQGVPEIIGEITKRWTDGAGRWVRVKLDKASEWAKRVWAAAVRGKARASSGTIEHLMRFAADGLITHWPFAELSLFDAEGKRQPANAYAVAMPVMKAMYQRAGKDLPESINDDGNAQPKAEAKGASKASAVNGGAVDTKTLGDIDMDEKDLIALLDRRDTERAAALAAEEERRKNEEVRIADAVKAEKAKWEADSAKGRRLPIGEKGINVAEDSDLWKFDGLDASEQAVMIGVLNSAHKNVTPSAYKALAVKLEEDKTETGELGRRAMKSAGMKTGEIDYSTSGSAGDDWVGISYSNSLWESIRLGTQVVNKLPQVEVPQGVESIYLPLESTDPTWYNVAENTTNGTSVGAPAPTVTSSVLATGRVLLTLGKLGARVVWSGELDEGSLIPFAGQLKTQLATSGAEYLESAVLDGDTTTSVANINATDGAGGVAGNWFVIWDGMRHSAIITTTANARAGGSLTVDDYIETVKLMGTSGLNALDVAKVGFVIGPSVHFKTLALPELLTKDVASSPTLEGGRLTGIWGYEVITSGSLCKNSAKRLTDSAGEISLTDSGNTYGTILSVRWDQWKFGWRRKMTMETTRFANSDSNEIVAMIRCGLIQRDTEASAVTYGVVV